MARDITSGFEDEIEAQNLNPIILTKAEFDSGDLLLWSGYGEIEFDSETYIGSGELLTISEVEETQELRANNVTYELSGQLQSLISIALSEPYQGRPVQSWFGVRDATGALIADPYRIFGGQMDVMEIEDAGENATIRVSSESDLINLRQKKERRYTPEDQKIENPSDTFFDFVPTIQDVTITWGAGRKD